MPAQLAASRALQPASSSLQFVHIPKNGGSSIEMFAGSIGRQWAGARDDWPEGPTPLCAYDFSFSEGDAVGGGSKWHVPPHVWKAHGQDPYAGSENFCVVRNPYTRIVSEFVYNQAFGRAGPGPECDGSVLNAWVNASLSAMIQLAVTPNAVPPANAGKYDCHLLPAAYYVGGDGCEHVLHFETLNSDFARLMADREGIADAELPHSNPAGCQMPVSLLDDKSRALIQQARPPPVSRQTSSFARAPQRACLSGASSALCLCDSSRDLRRVQHLLLAAVGPDAASLRTPARVSMAPSSDALRDPRGLLRVCAMGRSSRTTLRSSPTRRSRRTTASATWTRRSRC